MCPQSAAPSPPVFALLERLNTAFPRLGTEVTDAAVARRMLADLRGTPAPPTPLWSVRDEEIEGPGGGSLALRRYRPRDVPTHGTVLFLHGGGFVIGDLDTHDEIARRIAVAADVEVVAVDYRRAPEDPYPAALCDAWAALAHVAPEPRSGRLIVAGDSAGGNLAAALALLARDRGGPAIGGQLLLYPMLDDRRDSPSYTENGTGFYITAEHLRWFWEQYRPDDATPDPLAAPARAGDLSGLPPAHVVTAGLDPLRDEGEAFARALTAADVPVTTRRYDGAFHGFLAFPALLDLARDAFEDLGAVVADLTGGPAR